jgi:putative flippase GtrA
MAFFVGLTTAFLLNRVFVFSAERGTTWRTEAVRFLVVNLLGLAVTMVVSVGCLWILERTLGRSALVEGGAHFAGLSATTITSYIAHKTWTFAG